MGGNRIVTRGLFIISEVIDRVSFSFSRNLFGLNGIQDDVNRRNFLFSRMFVKLM